MYLSTIPCCLTHNIQGESGLAVATLERLGDDTESDLRQLMQGTVRRSLRLQIADEMKQRGYMRSNEWTMLETLALIEVCFCTLL
jgi:spatacsin